MESEDKKNTNLENKKYVEESEDYNDEDYDEDDTRFIGGKLVVEAE